MNPSVSRGTIAQVLGAATWIIGLTGHTQAAAILNNNPNLATEITTFIGLAFTIWGVAEHVYAAYVAQKAVAVLPKIPPKTLTEN